MNKVYKVVWNASLGVFVAVSELSKSKAKSSKTRTIGSVIAAGLMLTFSAEAIAAGAPMTTCTPSDIASIFNSNSLFGQNIVCAWNTTNSTLVGNNITAAGNSVNLVAVGNNISTGGESSTVLGSKITHSGRFTTVIGQNIKSRTEHSIVMGEDTTIDGGNYDISIGGNQNILNSQHTVALGNNIKTSGSLTSLAAGNDTTITNSRLATAVGDRTSVTDSTSASAFGAGSSITKADHATAVGHQASVNDSHSSFAGGVNASITGGYGNIAIGSSSTVSNTFGSSAIGYQSSVTGASRGMALGTQAKVTDSDRGTALGASASVTNSASASASGNNASVTDSSYAQADGAGAKVTSSKSATAVGNDAIVTNSGSATAVGNGANITNSASSVAVGQLASVTNSNVSTASGYKAKITDSYQAQAYGTGNSITNSNQASAFGVNSSITSSASGVAIGNNAKLNSAADGIAIGSSADVTSVANGIAIGKNAAVTTANSVALGANSTTSNAVATEKATVGSITYDGFEGKSPVGVVSVGSQGKERQITNVAAGQITANSTDAINGSQLFATQGVINNVATTTAGIIGGTTTVNPDGKLTTGPIGGTTQTTISGAINEVRETPLTFVGNARNSGDTKDVERKLGESLKISGAATTAGSYSGKNVRTVTDQTGSIAIELAENLDVTSVTAGNSKLDTTGLVITGGPSITTTGIDAGGSKITNVGNATTASDAVNKGQLDSSLANANSNAAVVYTNAAGDKVTKAADGKWYAATGVNADGSLIGSPSEVAAANIITSVQNANGSTTTATKLSNVAAGSVTASSTDAINGSQLYNTANNVKNLIGGTTTIDANTGVITTSNIGGTGKNTIDEAISSVKGAAETPMTFVGNARNSGDTKDVERKLGESLTISGAATTAGSYSGKNVRTVTDQTGSIAIELAENLDVTSVTAGNSKLDTTGLVITGGPSITTTGIDAGGSKITNVGNATTASDAVNKGQLDSSLANANSNAAVVYTNAAGDKVTKAADGKWYAATDVNADGSLIGSPSEVAAANIITSVQNANGSTTTATKLSNVAAGSVTASSTDAINGSQLYNTANNVKNLIGGTTTIDANTGVITTSNIGGTGKNTIDEAISSVKGAAETPMTFVGNARNSGDTKDVERKLGESLTISGAATTAGSYSGKNVRTVTDQTGSIAIELAENLDVTSVTAGNSKLDTTGLVITGGPSITTTGIDAGGSKITNVGNATTASDAVNKGQLDSSLANANSNAAVVYTNAAGDKVTKAADGKWYAATDVNADGSLIGSPSEVAAANIITSVQNANGSTTTATKLSNVAAGSVTASSTDAINGSQLYNTANNVKNLIGGTTTIDANTGVITTSDIGGTGKNTIDEAISSVKGAAETPMTFVGNARNSGDTKDVERKLGESLTISGAATTAGSYSGKNVRTVTDQTGSIAIELAENLDVTSVTAGNSKLDTTGLVITGGPSITTTGIDAGGSKITNVGNATTASDAVNKGQLDSSLANANSNAAVVYTNAAGDKVTKAADGKWYAATDVNADGSLIGSPSEVAAANIITSVQNANGSTTTATKLSNVAAGSVTASSTDAINGSQLYNTANNVKNLIGGTTTIDANTGVITTSNIGGTGQNTIDDAIKNVSTAATKAKTEVEAGKNITVTSTIGKDGQSIYTVATANEVSFDKLTVGPITVSNAGINAGNKVITNVAAGQKDTDAVNKGQLDNAITNINNKVDQVNNNAVQYDKNADGTVNKDKVTLGGDKGTTLTNVADGKVTQGSKDAVNGGQLADIRDNLQGQITNNTNDINNIKNEINNGSLGIVKQSDPKGEITVGKETGGTTVNMAGKDGDRVVTGVKDGAINATSKDAINGSQLHAQKVETNQKVVEYLGGGAAIDNITGSFTQAPSYTVGDSKYNNVGGAIDALNKADQALGNKIDNVSNRLEQAFYSTNQRIDDVEKRANAGIAAAMSLENAPYIPGKYTYAAGAAYHGGESAIGVTLRKTADNGRWSLTGGIAVASEGDPSVRIGISGVID